MGEASSAVTCYEESAEFLLKIPAKDLEVIVEILVSYSDFSLHYFYVPSILYVKQA